MFCCNWKFHDGRREILSSNEKDKFIEAYWDTTLSVVPNPALCNYLLARY